MKDWVFDLRHKEIVFTGKVDDYLREDLAAIALRLGANVKSDVGSSTDVLIRGASTRWKYGDYGNREKQVASMQRAGHRIVIIDGDGFHGLRSGFPAPTIKPNVPDIDAHRSAAEGGALGAPYRPGQFAEPVKLSGDYFKDPDAVDRGLHAHSATQDSLARHVESLGFAPLSAFDRDCNFDLAWDTRDGYCGVAEIKSLTTDNEIFQVRHGLGQILDYGFRLRSRGFNPRLYLVLEQSPQRFTHWAALCADHEVTMASSPSFQNVT